MQISNVLLAEFSFDSADPDGYRSAFANVGKLAGGEALAVKAYELPVGQSICPYHYEYEEEWLLVLGGQVTVRTPEGREQVSRGGLVCFPPGPDGAHKITNESDESANVVMFSSSREPAVAVYPDSDKVGVWPGNPGDNVMLKRADGRVGYWEGER
jgi:uncharacterized cupin superfamily protein